PQETGASRAICGSSTYSLSGTRRPRGWRLKLAVEILRYVSLGAYVALALATINQWRRQRDLAAAWSALCFGTLGLVVVLGRMRILAFAAALLTITLFLAAATSRSYSVLALVSSALGIVSALAFLVALAPPAVVRMIWRRPAQERVQDAVRDLIALSRSQAEV